MIRVCLQYRPVGRQQSRCGAPVSVVESRNCYFVGSFMEIQSENLDCLEEAFGICRFQKNL
uniref:Uncharacterized protein n=1 Tax=Oryza barthii TaxID=65489 RepID=A0A0D3H6Z5_9ORYZ